MPQSVSLSKFVSVIAILFIIALYVPQIISSDRNYGEFLMYLFIFGSRLWDSPKGERSRLGFKTKRQIINVLILVLFATTLAVLLWFSPNLRYYSLPVLPDVELSAVQLDEVAYNFEEVLAIDRRHLVLEISLINKTFREQRISTSDFELRQDEDRFSAIRERYLNSDWNDYCGHTTIAPNETLSCQLVFEVPRNMQQSRLVLDNFLGYSDAFSMDIN